MMSKPASASDPLDAATAAVAVVESDVGGVDLVVATQRCHGVAVALIDRGLGGPKRGHRLSRVAHPGEGLGVDPTHQSPPAILGLGADGGHAG